MIRLPLSDVPSAFRGAEGYSLVLDRLSLRRGESVLATVLVSDATAIAGVFELGVVCTERWSEYHAGGGGGAGGNGRRVTREAPLYQWWMPLDRNQQRTELTLPIVPEAPFSHVGSALSFLWTVTARDRRSGFDHLDRVDLEVLP